LPAVEAAQAARDRVLLRQQQRVEDVDQLERLAVVELRQAGLEAALRRQPAEREPGEVEFELADELHQRRQ